MTTSDAKTTCACLQQLKDQGYEFPFEQRISFSIEAIASLVTPWGVSLQRKTKAGKKSSAGSRFVLLNYCPICGKDLRGESDDACKSS